MLKISNILTLNLIVFLLLSVSVFGQTEELRVKGAVIFKVGSNSTATVSGSGVALNNEGGTISS